MRYAITSMLTFFASVGESKALQLRSSDSIQEDQASDVAIAETDATAEGSDSGATSRRLDELKSKILREVDETDDDYRRRLIGCYGSTTTPSAAWHPIYSLGWTNGYCRYTVDCDSPSYSTELACCKGAYAGQWNGYCLSRLPNPPTVSPVSSKGLDVYYPDYDTAWPEAYCINDYPMPNGRPKYATMLECCKSAYGGQISGKCLSMLPSPPTSSPTNSAREADFWYPEYEKPWANAGCSNKLPLPYRHKNDRPSYKSHLECCKAAYAGQMSGSCLAGLPNPPTASPNGSGGTGLWWPDYDTSWSSATCVDRGWDKSYPLQGSRPLYDSNLACCAGSYRGQISLACYCAIKPTPEDCPGAVKFTATTALGVTVTTTITLGDITVPPAGPERNALIASLESAIEATVEATLGPGDSVLNVSILSIGGETLRRKLWSVTLHRLLQGGTTDIVVEIELETETSCEEESCTDIDVEEVGDDIGDEIVTSFKNGGLANAFTKSRNPILMEVANKGGIKGVTNPIAIANRCKNEGKGKGKGKDKKGCESSSDTSSDTSSAPTPTATDDSLASSSEGTLDPLSSAPTPAATEDNLLSN